MKDPKLGDYILWKGELAKIIGEANNRFVIIEMQHECKCPHCNGNLGKEQINVIVSSPLFQENAQPVSTMKESK